MKRKIKGILSLLSIYTVTNVNADREMLLDTSVQTSDLVKEGPDGWTIPPKSEWMDITGMDADQNPVRVLTLCKKPNPEGNFVISPFIPTGGATQVQVEINYYMRACKTLNKYRSKCVEEIDILTAEATDSKSRNLNTDTWNQIDTIKATDSKKVLTIETKQNGISIAFKDYGSCTQISSVRVWSEVCAEKVIQFAKYEATPNGQKLEGKCVKNAVLVSYFSAPELQCTDNGWEETATGCACKDGHQPNSDNTECIPCRNGTYKQAVGNGSCVTCPLNSYSTVLGQSSCKCNTGHYRSGADVDQECKGIPSMPTDLKYSPDKSSAVLQWKRPYDYYGNDLFYRVTCEVCDSEQASKCDACDPDKILYSLGPEDIPDDPTGNELNVQNLDASSVYKFMIFALNSVSEVAEAEGQSSKFGIISVQTKMFNHVETPEAVGSVKVELGNNGEARVTWGAVDTDSYEMRIFGPEYGSKPKIIAIPKENDVHTLNELVSDSTYRIQVRARLNGQSGPWSIQEVFKTSQNSENSFSTPSVEMVELSENETSTNWIAIVIFAVVMVVGLFSILIFFFVRNVNRNWSKASQGSYGKASDGTIDAHFDLIPQIVRKSPTQIDGMSLTSDSGALPAHSDMTTGYYHQQPVLLQYGYLSDEQYAHVTQLDHENILKCIGFAPSRQQLVFEHAPHGTLPTVVGYHRFDIVAIVKMLRDISSGMRLLHAHSFVHRNLTSYNIFVGSDFTPKIAKYLSNDFRPDYRRSALEVWENQPFTPATDVYSFGILMWEIFQIFSQADPEPFRGFSETEVLEQLRSGRNLPRPGDCPEQAYKLMEACWAYRPSNRPNFIQIYVELENILNQMENCVAV